MHEEVVDRITLPEARYLALVAQRLESPEPLEADRPALLATARQVSTLQLDSISVVSRAHETALWSRHGTFALDDFAPLHYPERQLIEYWAHAASLLPVEFFPYLRRRMLHYRDLERSRWAQWAAAHHELLDHVLETIRVEGPCSTRVFSRPEGKDRARWEWFGGKPAKQALDFLWTRGDLVINRRVNFEREYELTERAFPHLVEAPLPPPEDERRFYTKRSLRALGIGTVSWISGYFMSAGGRFVSNPETLTALRALAAEGRALPVQLELPSGPVHAWLDPDLLPALRSVRAGALRPRKRTLLTPFDNLLWRRERALALFGFDYQIESYTREPDRVYGYHTLPILIDGALVGRLDPRFRRKERCLELVSVHLEPDIRPSAALANAIAEAVRSLGAFLGAERYALRITNPPSLFRLLTRRLG